MKNVCIENNISNEFNELADTLQEVCKFARKAEKVINKEKKKRVSKNSSQDNESRVLSGLLGKKVEKFDDLTGIEVYEVIVKILEKNHSKIDPALLEVQREILTGGHE